MATRGYQSYRGRNHGKLALVIVLVLILLAAVGYLVAQEYMVYDDEGPPASGAALPEKGTDGAAPAAGGHHAG